MANNTGPHGRQGEYRTALLRRVVFGRRTAGLTIGCTITAAPRHAGITQAG